MCVLDVQGTIVFVNVFIFLGGKVMRKFNLTLVCVFALLFCAAPSAQAIVAGFNVDIHMDMPDVIANDFHVERAVAVDNPVGAGFSNSAITLQSSVIADVI